MHVANTRTVKNNKYSELVWWLYKFEVEFVIWQLAREENRYEPPSRLSKRPEQTHYIQGMGVFGRAVSEIPFLNLTHTSVNFDTVTSQHEPSIFKWIQRYTKSESSWWSVVLTTSHTTCQWSSMGVGEHCFLHYSPHGQAPHIQKWCPQNKLFVVTILTHELMLMACPLKPCCLEYHIQYAILYCTRQAQ